MIGRLVRRVLDALAAEGVELRPHAFAGETVAGVYDISNQHTMPDWSTVSVFATPPPSMGNRSGRVGTAEPVGNQDVIAPVDDLREDFHASPQGVEFCPDPCDVCAASGADAGLVRDQPILDLLHDGLGRSKHSHADPSPSAHDSVATTADIETASVRGAAGTSESLAGVSVAARDAEQRDDLPRGCGR